MIAVGFLMESAVEKVAKEFPNTKFAIIDSGPAKPIPNVKGLLFKEQEGGYLVGYLAGLVRQDERRLDRRRPEDPAGRPLHRRLPGGRQGGRPGASRRSTATRRTSSTRRSARRSRSNQIAQGSDVVFQVAGQCGLGALDAAKEKGV